MMSARTDSISRMRCTKPSSCSAMLLRSSPNAFEYKPSTTAAELGDEVGAGYNVCGELVETGETVRDLRFRIVWRGGRLNAAAVEGSGREEQVSGPKSGGDWRGIKSERRVTPKTTRTRHDNRIYTEAEKKQNPQNDPADSASLSSTGQHPIGGNY